MNKGATCRKQKFSCKDLEILSAAGDKHIKWIKSFAERQYHTFFLFVVPRFLCRYIKAYICDYIYIYGGQWDQWEGEKGGWVVRQTISTRKIHMYGGGFTMKKTWFNRFFSFSFSFFFSFLFTILIYYINRESEYLYEKSILSAVNV